MGKGVILSADEGQETLIYVNETAEGQPASQEYTDQSGPSFTGDPGDVITFSYDDNERPSIEGLEEVGRATGEIVLVPYTIRITTIDGTNLLEEDQYYFIDTSGDFGNNIGFSGEVTCAPIESATGVKVGFLQEA